MGQIKNIKLHIVTDIKKKSHKNLHHPTRTREVMEVSWSSFLSLLVIIVLLSSDSVWSGITEYSSRDGSWDPDAYTPNDNTIMAQNVIVLKKTDIPPNTELDADMDAKDKEKFNGLKMGKCIVYCMTEQKCKSVTFDDFGGQKSSKCVRSTASWRNATMQAKFITGDDTDTETIITYALK